MRLRVPSSIPQSAIRNPQWGDADAILAAQAVLACDPADTVTVATTNVGHLARFVAARPWDQIAP
jgi:hypothetical protein